MGKFENDANTQYTPFNNYEYKGGSKNLSIKNTQQTLTSPNENTQVETLDLDFDNQSNSKTTILNETNSPELNNNRLNPSQSNNNQTTKITGQSTSNNNQTITKGPNSNEQITSSTAHKPTSNKLETKDKGTTSIGAATGGITPNSGNSSSNVNSTNTNQPSNIKSTNTNSKESMKGNENQAILGEREQKNTSDFTKYINEAKYEINNAEIDIEAIDPSTLTEEDLQQLIGAMTEEQYDEFTSNVKAFYNNQIKYIENLLNGTDKQEGIKELLEEYEQVYNFLFSPDNEIARVNNRIDESIDYYLKYTNKLEELEINAESFASMNREEQIQMLKEKDEGVKLELESLNELLENQKKALDQAFPEENFKNYDEFKQMYDLLKYQVSTQEENLNLYKNLVESVEYDYLYYLQDFDEYGFKTEFTEAEIEKFNEEARNEANNNYSYLGAEMDSFSWKEYSEKHPEVTPLEFMLMSKEASAIKFALYNNVPNYEELNVMLKVKDQFPQFAKTYNYLYQKNPKEAEKFLEKCKYELNNIEGQIEAQVFLSGLDVDDGKEDKLGAIANELGVSTQGLVDGLDSFCNGLYYSLEALGTSLGICEENRTLSVSEYKKMYILQALLPQSKKEEAGLIVKDESGKYNNRDSNSLIDYTTEYSGGFLNNNYEISQGIGNMLPSIALGTICPIAGSISLGASAGGNSYHNAMVEGNSLFSSIMYGIFSGSTEAITERFLGALPGLSDVQITSFKSYLQSMLKEGTQESIQGTIDILYQTVFMGKELPTTVEGWKELATDIGKQGIYGAITAGILNSPSLVGINISGKNLNTQEKQQIKDLKVETINSDNLKDSAKNINKDLESETRAETVKVENKEYINEQNKETEINKVSEKLENEEIKYSPYTLEQLNSDKNYKNICEKFLSLAKDKETKEILESILYNGGYKNYVPDANLFKSNPAIDAARRIDLAYLLIRNPETFNALVDNDITYFHGVNSNALSGILENGLKSLKTLTEEGTDVLTGEKWSTVSGKERDFVSFTDILGVSEEYSCCGFKNETDFPIIIGTSKEEISKVHTKNIDSAIPEIGVKGLPRESIKTIMVPSTKVDMVKKLINDDTILVLPMDDMGKKFYSNCWPDFTLNINEKSFDDFKEKMLFNQSIKWFKNLNGQNALEEVTRSGTIFEIKDLTNQQIKELLKSNDITLEQLTTTQVLELLNNNYITMNQIARELGLEFIQENGLKYTIHDLTYKQVSELSKNGKITTKETLDYIELGLKNGRLTKENINEMFTKLVGTNLSSWVPTADQAYTIYTELLKACGNADIDIQQLTKGLKVMETVEDYYIEASDLNNQLQTGKKIFSTYRTHGVIHIFDVLTQSINSINAMKKVGIEGIDNDTVMLSAIMHDTGMSGGQQLVLSVGEDKKIKISTQEAQKDGATYRESHSFNSGVKIIENYQQLSDAGYTNEQIAEAALLAFAHSKSNSGLNPLSANQAGWSFAIQALDAARTYARIDFDFLGALKSAGIIVSTDLTGGTSSEYLEVKSPKTYKTDENGNIVKVDGKPDKGDEDGKGGKVKGKIDMYEFGDGVINDLSYEALTVRIGDALTNNDNAITNQYLGDISFETTDYSKQFTTEQVLDKIIADGIVEDTTTKDNIIATLLGIKDALQNAAFAETKHNTESDSVTFEVNGEQLNDSQPFVLGENNQTYDIETKENEIDIIVNIKDSNAVPFSTIFAIEERAGELTSKGTNILSQSPRSDGKILKLVIKLDKTTKPEIRELYNQYEEAYKNDERIKVIVE